MRCWDCKRIVPLPEIIDGKPGIAGMLRAGAVCPPGTKLPQVVSLEAVCGCGACYIITTARMPGFVTVARAEPTEEQAERMRIWGK